MATARLIDVPRETWQELEELRRLIALENGRQNLVSSATLEPEVFRHRHLVDCAQLVRFAPDAETWLDIGSGAGLPGLVIALLTRKPVLLVEPRRRRADFLISAAEQLGISGQVSVNQVMVQAVPSNVGPFAAITARAVASLSVLFTHASHLASTKTVWILPKGRSASAELASAKETWQGRFHTEPSVTAEDSSIVVARDVRRKGGK